MATDFISSLLDFPPEKQLSHKDYDKKINDLQMRVSGLSHPTISKQEPEPVVEIVFH